MEIIKKLSKKIKEELCDSKDYVELALKYKTDYPDVARLFYNLSNEEMKHMEMLHNAVINIIEDYKRNKGEPPEGMMAIYEYLHEEQIELASEVKILQNMYAK